MAIKHILVATDFSACSEGALELALELAEKFDARLTLTHVWEVPGLSYGVEFYLPSDQQTSFEQAAHARLVEALQILKARFPKAESLLREGDPWEEIVNAAQTVGADLIVLGTHGRRGLSRALLGSVAERVVRLAPVPVLTVHGAQAALSVAAAQVVGQ